MFFFFCLFLLEMIFNCGDAFLFLFLFFIYIGFSQWVYLINNFFLLVFLQQFWP